MKNNLEGFDASQIKPIRDKIYELLRKRIFAGLYSAGEKLVETNIAREMQVSRTPVREAFRKLESEGLVEHVPRKGIFVKVLKKNDILEVYSIRIVLEGLASKSAAENIAQEEIIKLKVTLNKMDEALKDEEIELFKSLCIKFNNIIRTASNMPRLIKMIAQLEEYTEETREITLSSKNRRENVMQEHKDIFEALAKKDSVASEEATKNHINNAKNSYLKYTGE